MTIEGVEFSGNNSQDSVSGGTIYVRSNGHIISGNSFVEGDNPMSAGFGIRLLGGGTEDSMVAGNDLTAIVDGNVTKLSANAYDNVHDNPGFPQTFKALATIGADLTTVSIPHGCDQTPTLSDCSISPTGNFPLVDRWCVSSVDATSITIEMNAA